MAPILKATYPRRSYHPVKFQIDRQRHLRMRVRKRYFKMVAMVAILFFQSGTNLQSNLAYVVPHHPVKFQIDRQKHLQVRVHKRKDFKMVSMNSHTIFYLVFAVILTKAVIFS